MAPAWEPPVCRVAATPYPAYKWHWTHHYTGSVGPRKRSAAGHGPSRESPVCRVAAAPYPAYKLSAAQAGSFPGRANRE
ncbi:hypothetical protein LNQ03_15050 [Klebsiella pneumoniae subsp. pneumoniae]|nr:hypothetical protein [Klebsiella pneumoniae subsp. pneumoniae]